MPKTLLLADDSVVIQKLAALSFANEDIELVTVYNGDEAIDRARSAHPDLVLADVVMPGKNGYEVCQAIKGDPQLQHIPVLLLTGTFEAFDEERAQNAGADGHITKPFESQALVDRVKELLRDGADSSHSPAAARDEDYTFFAEQDEASAVEAPAPAELPDALAPSAAAEGFAVDVGDPPTLDPLDPSPTPADLPGAGELDSLPIFTPISDLPSGAAGERTVALIPESPELEGFPGAPGAIHSQPSTQDLDDPVASDVRDGPESVQAITSPGVESSPDLPGHGAASGWDDLEASAPAAADPVAEDLFADTPVPGVVGPEGGIDLDPAPSAPVSPNLGAPLDLDLDLDLEADALEPLSETDFDAAGGSAYDVSTSDLADSFSTLTPPPADAPAAPNPVAPEVTPRTASAPESRPDLSPLMRERIHETLEKVAWEAFADLSDTVVRQVLESVERIAWEVIPQMAESMIQEEIRRMKDEPES